MHPLQPVDCGNEGKPRAYPRSIEWHACCTVGVAEVTTMNIVTPAVIPPDFLGLLLPGALFAVWSVLVVATLVGLSVVLAMDGTRSSIAVESLPLAAGERDAA
jgi:hypothetical protein